MAGFDWPPRVTQADGRVQEVAWASLEEAARRNLLPNQNAKVTTAKRTMSGKLEFLPSNIGLEKGSYRVTVDYSKYRDESVLDQNKKFVGRGKVGVALRVIADVTTTKNNVNLGGLLNLAIQRNSGSVSGQLQVTVIGIQHPDISKLIVLPSNLDETSITKALESIGSIKVLVDAETTRTTPQLIAISRRNISNPLAIIQAVAPIV